MGVNLFFILSGFVLYLPFADGRRHLDRWPDVTGFLRHRARRLLPLYYFNCAILFALYYHPESARAAICQFLALLTVTFNFSAATFMPQTNWVLWSLGIEIWFTFAFVIVAYLIPRIGLLAVAIATFIIACSFRQAGAIAHFDAYALTSGLGARLDDFVAGMLIAVWYARGAKPIFTDAWLSWLCVPAGLVLVTCAAILFDDHVASWLSTLGSTVFEAGIALILCSLLSRHARPAQGRLWLPLELMGLMCYSIYIWHGVVLVGIRTRFMPLFAPGLHGAAYHLVQIGLYLAVLAPIAWMSYRYVEFGSVKNWRTLMPSSTTRQ